MMKIPCLVYIFSLTARCKQGHIAEGLKKRIKEYRRTPKTMIQTTTKVPQAGECEKFLMHGTLKP